MRCINMWKYDELTESEPTFGWGAPYFSEDSWTTVAQVLAAATMLGPILVSYIITTRSLCEGHIFDGSPTGTGLLAWVLIIPGSFANHLACAANRKWITVYQKCDRIGVGIAASLCCWACSQNVVYTSISILATSVFAVMLTFGFSYLPMSADTANLIAGALVAFACISMQVPNDWQDWQLNPYCLGGVLSMSAGGAVFLSTPIRAWTDSLWHLFITCFAFFTSLQTVKLERELYGGC